MYLRTASKEIFLWLSSDRRGLNMLYYNKEYELVVHI